VGVAPRTLGVNAQLAQDETGDSFLFQQQSKKNVFRSDERMPHGARFLRCQS